ncbi:acyl-CoA thioesterase [Bdellovibrio svalbardensis]|uniref:Thioesterase family protein n=1 Tax=Bdellovibrio svalbardensis TaxID=2972972 RepID=A0ABT6DKS1_9BACT|nr:acyl-CoA thioesterase [Bdellovibrio svalbardensis]MDG0817112.1 thioesterase family protein [Bdellovibrio svalbardensis]
MNLFFRLIWTYIISRFRSKLGVLDVCPTPFRVLPTDLDVLRHMNNGVYFSLQDLARTDYMIRIGALDTISSKGWYPVVVAERLRFRKSLKLFQKFEIQTKLVFWDDKYIYIEHTFMSGGEAVAWGTIRTRFLSKKGGIVSPKELMSALGHDLAPAQMTEYLKNWAAAEDAHSTAIRPS